MRRRGIEALNQVRDEARRVAPLIGREGESATFDKLVGALLGTRVKCFRLASILSDRSQMRFVYFKRLIGYSRRSANDDATS